MKNLFTNARAAILITRTRALPSFSLGRWQRETVGSKREPHRSSWARRGTRHLAGDHKQPKMLPEIRTISIN
jgi:hypothetical protein